MEHEDVATLPFPARDDYSHIFTDEDLDWRPSQEDLAYLTATDTQTAELLCELDAKVSPPDTQTVEALAQSTGAIVLNPGSSSSAGPGGQALPVTAILPDSPM